MKLLSHNVCCFAAVIALLTFPAASAQSATASTATEDLTSASVASSQLHADPPELVEKDEQPEYISEWITVRWRPDDPIYLYVVRPSKMEKPPVVIYLHDYPAETDIFRDDDWCKSVTARGYAAVGFVPALSGHRYHDRSMKEWFVSELQEALAKSSHDVQMVLSYLDQRGDVDMNRVGMFGEGAGATIAVMAASADSRIKAVDVVDPWGDWPAWMAKSKVIPDEERSAYVKPDFLQKIADFDPVFLLPKLKTPHIRLVQSDDMAATPEEAKKRIEAATPSSAEKRRRQNSAKSDGAGTSGEYDLDWLKLQLKAAEAKQDNGKMATGATAGEPEPASQKP
jgi:hypothetical protein